MSTKKGARSVLIPEISVITPTFNRALLLSGAIESVLAQSFFNFEYLIIDDGSEDDTEKVVRRYFKDPRLFYFHKKNGGQTSALNVGLRFARAPWLAFLDSDDEFRPDHLKYLLEKAKKPSPVDFVIGSFEVPGARKENCYVADYRRPFHKISLAQVEVVQGTLLIQTKAAREVGGFRSVLSDIDIVERLKLKGYRWRKASKPTLRYFFGRTSDSISFDYLRKQAKVTSKRRNIS